MRRMLIVVASLVSLALLAGLGTLAYLHAVDDQVGIAQPAGGATNFDGRLLVISDADQQATAYGDGVLNRLPGIRDTLTVFDDADGDPGVSGSVEVSNSVIGWPVSVDVARDGKHAYVIEVRGSPPKEVERVDDVFVAFPKGRLLNVVDLSDPASPTVVWSESIGENLASVAIRPDGGMLVIGSEQEGEELLLYELDDVGMPETRHAFPIDAPAGALAPARVRSVTWHPSGDFIAANVSDRGVVFFRVEYDEQGIPTSMIQLGDPVVIGETLTAGEFHPNGRFFLIPDVSWGTMLKATDYITNGRGRLFTIEMREDGEHRVVGQTTVGRSPEGFAVSANGEHVVTVNMNRTYLPDAFPANLLPGREANSLTLLRFDPETGATRVVDEQGFDGLLPEDAVFDADGDALAVVIYHHRDRQTDRGFVDFWRVENDRLVPTGTEVPVSRGAHGLVLAAQH